MMTLIIAVGMDEKVNSKEIWEKTAPHGRFHQEAIVERRVFLVLFAKS